MLDATHGPCVVLPAGARYILVDSLIVVVMLRTRWPLEMGENLTRAVRVSPTAQALWGTMMEYMSFSGQVALDLEGLLVFKGLGGEGTGDKDRDLGDDGWGKAGTSATARSL